MGVRWRASFRRDLLNRRSRLLYIWRRVQVRISDSSQQGTCCAARFVRSDTSRTSACEGEVNQPRPRMPPHLIRVREAAQITGLPISLIRKSFMREDKRPENVPPPPPHKRIGRAIYILADELSLWVRSLGKSPPTPTTKMRRQGRPTVSERIARREQEPTEAAAPNSGHPTKNSTLR
jgi:hypothetical protein